MTPTTETDFENARAEIVDALEQAVSPSMPSVSMESIRMLLERADRLARVEAQLARARSTLRLFREQVAMVLPMSLPRRAKAEPGDCSSSGARPITTGMDTTTPGEGIGVWRVGARVQRDPMPVAGGLEITRVRVHDSLMTIETACVMDFTGRPVGDRLVMQGRPGTEFVDAVFVGPAPDRPAISNTPEPAS